MHVNVQQTLDKMDPLVRDSIAKLIKDERTLTTFFHRAMQYLGTVEELRAATLANEATYNYDEHKYGTPGYVNFPDRDPKYLAISRALEGSWEQLNNEHEDTAFQMLRLIWLMTPSLRKNILSAMVTDLAGYEPTVTPEPTPDPCA